MPTLNVLLVCGNNLVAKDSNGKSGTVRLFFLFSAPVCLLFFEKRTNSCNLLQHNKLPLLTNGTKHNKHKTQLKHRSIRLLDRRWHHSQVLHQD